MELCLTIQWELFSFKIAPRRSWTLSKNIARFCGSRADCCMSILEVCHLQLHQLRSGCRLAIQLASLSRQAMLTLPNSNTLFEGYVIPVHIHHVHFNGTPKFAQHHSCTNVWHGMAPSQICWCTIHEPRVSEIAHMLSLLTMLGILIQHILTSYDSTQPAASG